MNYEKPRESHKHEKRTAKRSGLTRPHPPPKNNTRGACRHNGTSKGKASIKAHLAARIVAVAMSAARIGTRSKGGILSEHRADRGCCEHKKRQHSFLRKAKQKGLLCWVLGDILQKKVLENKFKLLILSAEEKRQSKANGYNGAVEGEHCGAERI